MLYTNKLWINDIDKTICNFQEFYKFNNKSILITGATGLICSAIIELLLRFNEKYNISLHPGKLYQVYSETTFPPKRSFPSDDRPQYPLHPFSGRKEPSRVSSPITAESNSPTVSKRLSLIFI